MKSRVLILEGDIKIGLSIQGFPLHTMCSLQLPIVSIRITIKTMNYITDIDECTSSPCENGGTCTQGINLYNCSCEQVIQEKSVKQVSVYMYQVF